jgi:hypothetical protein
MSNDLVIVMCPSHSDYPEAPKDQSHSELRDCPKCKNKMWLSEKKKGVLMFASCLQKNILLACYHCITKLAKEEPELFTESKRVKL